MLTYFLFADEIQENNQRPHYQTNTYNVKPLFFFGCGIGWFSWVLLILSSYPWIIYSELRRLTFFLLIKILFRFTLGFLFPFLWYFATILYFRNYHLRNPRERQGLAASAIAVKNLTPDISLNFFNLTWNVLCCLWFTPQALICSVAVLVALLIALIPRN